MKAIIILAFCFSACFCRPQALFAQESLLTKTMNGGIGMVYSVAVSPDGKYLAAGGEGTDLKVWDLESGSFFKKLPGHNSLVNSVAFSPDGAQLLSASEDAYIKIWDVKTGACLRTLKGHEDSVTSARYFPDGKSIVSSSADGTIRLWRSDSAAPYRTIRAGEGYINSVAVSPDGKRIAAACADKTVKVWDAESGKRLFVMQGHRGAVNSVAFAPGGAQLASGSQDGEIKFWRLTDGLCMRTFGTFNHPVLSVAYSRDGDHLFSGGADKLVTIWSIAANARIITFTGHGKTVRSVAPYPDGKLVASGSSDGTIKLWLTPWESERRNMEILASNRLESEKDGAYAMHYAAGVLALSSPTALNVQKSYDEFTQALTFRKTEECQAKLAEAVKLLDGMKAEMEKARLQKEADEAAARSLAEKQQRERAVLWGKAAAAAVAVIIFFRWAGRALKRRGFRKTFPLQVKLAVASGDYDTVAERFGAYKAIGGKVSALPQDDLLRLYHGTGHLDDLPREELPYGFLLSCAAKFAKAGDHRTAFHMLRSGQLLEEFRAPADFDAFAEIFVRTGKPEHLLTRKFKPAVYSALAEAFFRRGEYDLCRKVCGFKQQLHASKLTRRDKELIALPPQPPAAAAPENAA